MMFRLRGAALAAVALGLPNLTGALPTMPRSEDPCAKVAGKTFVPPTDALACLKSFPFNETLRQNVMSVVSTVFDFYTFEDYYLNSPPPFQESTKNIRAQLSRINSTKYEVSVCSILDLFIFLDHSSTRRITTSTRTSLTRPTRLTTVTQV